MSTSATPYLEIKFEKGRGGTSYTYKTTDSPNKIKALRHTEEPYNSTAILVLDNYDRALPDLFGYYCTIGYGYNTASGDKKSDAAPLWVKRQFHTSKMGSLDNIIYMEGAWNLLGEMRDIASLLGATSPPYYEVDYTATSFTIYDIIKQVLNVAGFGLYALGAEDDSIVDTLQPDFVVNAVPFENAATIIYRLMNMTKVFCRTEVPQAVQVTGPHTIATSTNANPVGGASNRSAFYAVGLYWQFYHDGTNLVFETSSDGETWTGSVTTVRASDGFDIYYDAINNKVYYVAIYSSDKKIAFRKGTPETDGTITWIAAEQEALDAGADLISNPYVAVDIDEYPWIGYRLRALTNDPLITKSDTNDGTWSVETNFPYNFQSGTTGSWRVVPIPLANGKMYVIFSTSSDDVVIKGRLWDDSWGGEESVASSISTGVSYLGKGNDVHAVYTVAGKDIKYIKRTHGTGWGSAETVASGFTDVRPVISNNEVTQELVCFWSDTGDRTVLSYSIRGESTWSTAATLASDTYIRVASVSAAAQIYSDQIIVSYGENQNSPYDVKCAKLEPPLNTSFRIKYPSGYGSYDYTYTSDKPASTDHQFREFEWRDQNKIPNVVYVLANQSADGNWDSVIVGGGEQYAKADNNNYPDIVEYYVASTLANQTDANNRATAIALRRWFEAQLARVVVSHNCGQELYDWIKIRDKRGTSSYADYPPSRWDNGAVVGALTHVYDPARGVYDLEITINGIESSAPVDATVPTIPMEEEIGITQEAMEGMKETVKVWSEQTGQNVAENLEAFAKGIEELRHRVEVGTLMPERATVTYAEWAKRFGYPEYLFKTKEDWAESRKTMKKYYDWAWGIE